MRLPAVGVVANQTSFRISTNAAAFTPLVSVGRTQPVGAFLQGPALSFVSPQANETAEVQVFLEMVREIAAGENISLRLPGFVAPLLTPFRDLNNSVDCRWDPRAERLTMTLLASLATNITIRLAPGRLRLPADGVRGGGAGFLVEVQSVAVPLHASPLESVQAVGAFSALLRTTLRPPEAGAPARLDIALVPDMRIAAGESIRFTLPGFTVPGGDVLLSGEQVASAPPGALASLGWDANTSTLQLLFGADVAAKTRVSVAVDALGLVVPPDGVRRAPGYEISTDAEAGPVQTLNPEP